MGDSALTVTEPSEADKLESATAQKLREEFQALGMLIKLLTTLNTSPIFNLDSGMDEQPSVYLSREQAQRSMAVNAVTKLLTRDSEIVAATIATVPTVTSGPRTKTTVPSGSIGLIAVEDRDHCMVHGRRPEDLSDVETNEIASAYTAPITSLANPDHRDSIRYFGGKKSPQLILAPPGQSLWQTIKDVPLGSNGILGMQ